MIHLLYLFRKPPSGSVVENSLENGTGALNIDICRVPVDNPTKPRPDGAKGRLPSNVILVHNGCEADCDAECVVAHLDQQSGKLVSKSGKPRKGAKGDGWGMTHTGAEYDDIGGASKFFTKISQNPPCETPNLPEGDT